MPDLSQYFPITDPTLIFFVVLLIILFAPIVMGSDATTRLSCSARWDSTT